MLAEGIIYGYKRDKSMRPIIIVQCEKILDMTVSDFVLFTDLDGL